MNEWIRLDKQAPPVNKEVELRVVNQNNGNEYVIRNTLMINAYGFYDWADSMGRFITNNYTVTAWRKIDRKEELLNKALNALEELKKQYPDIPLLIEAPSFNSPAVPIKEALFYIGMRDELVIDIE